MDASGDEADAASDQGIAAYSALGLGADLAADVETGVESSCASSEELDSPYSAAEPPRLARRRSTSSCYS